MLLNNTRPSLLSTRTQHTLKLSKPLVILVVSTQTQSPNPEAHLQQPEPVGAEIAATTIPEGSVLFLEYEYKLPKTLFLLTKAHKIKIPKLPKTLF